MNAVELASRILTQLGFYQEPSKELGIDDRRDNIVHLIEEYTHLAKTLTDEEIHLVREVLDGCVSIIKTEIDQEKQTFKGYEHCSNLPSLESELKDAEKAVVILKTLQGK